MSGGGGGIIILDDVKSTLSDPRVHGQLPADMRNLIDPILAKDTADWTFQDRAVISVVHGWAILHLQ